MELDKLVTTFGVLGGLAIFSWPYLMKILDKMTTSKASHVAAEDRIDEAQTGLVDKAFTQNAELQKKLFDELDRRARDQQVQSEVLNVFAKELKLATDTLLTAVKRVENVLVFVGDMDIRSGTYFKSIMDDINEIKAHIRKDISQ